MRRHPLDDATADRLLSGRLSPEDAPPGFEHAADLVRAAQRSAEPTPVGMAREAAVVAAMAAAVHPVIGTTVRRKPMLAKVLTAKVAAAAAAGLLTATAAAAATNTLPDKAQTAVSDAASHVGIDLPKPAADHGKSGANHGKSANHKPGTPTTHAPGNDNATGPDATGAAKYGLCRAWSSGSATTNPHSHKADAVAFQNLAKAASDAHQTITQYCKDALAAHESTSTTVTTEKPESTDNGQGKGQGETHGEGHAPSSTVPTVPGEAGDHAPVSVPANGGANHDNPGSSHATAGQAHRP